MSKIKINKELYAKIKEHADKIGYSSADEFVEHVLEQILQTSTPEDMDGDVMERLKGLGYIS